MKFLYILAGTTPRHSALVPFQGAKLSHHFKWSEKHKGHIYDGRELNAEEFNGLVDELFTHNHNECVFKVIPRVVDIKPEPVAAPVIPPAPEAKAPEPEQPRTLRRLRDQLATV